MKETIQFIKPLWVFSRTYDFGKKNSKTLITNTNWCADYVLDEMSSDIWFLLPGKFTLEELGNILLRINVDLQNENSDVKITLIFTDLPEKVVIDDSNETELKKEY